MSLGCRAVASFGQVAQNGVVLLECSRLESWGKGKDKVGARLIVASTAPVGLLLVALQLLSSSVVCCGTATPRGLAYRNLDTLLLGL